MLDQILLLDLGLQIFDICSKDDLLILVFLLPGIHLVDHLQKHTPQILWMDLVVPVGLLLSQLSLCSVRISRQKVDQVLILICHCLQLDPHVLSLNLQMQALRALLHIVLLQQLHQLLQLQHIPNDLLIRSYRDLLFSHSVPVEHHLDETLIHILRVNRVLLENKGRQVADGGGGVCLGGGQGHDEHTEVDDQVNVGRFGFKGFCCQLLLNLFNQFYELVI